MISALQGQLTCVSLKSRKTIGGGLESDGLYYLYAPLAVAPKALTTDSPFLWHCRLGHPAPTKLSLFVSIPSILNCFDCEACELGKHHRISFPLRENNRRLVPFDLVHSDVWSPSPTTALLGFNYFVTFIDDYSRMTWLFLLKNHSEIYGVFQKFYNEVQN